MEFSPKNKIVVLCLRGARSQEQGNTAEAQGLFAQAWETADSDLERFISAHFIARAQSSASEELSWHETSLQLAMKISDGSTQSALPPIYLSIANCHEKLGEPVEARRYRELAESCNMEPSDRGPFFHGTKAALAIGDFLTAGESSNYKNDLKMNHVYFTALPNGAGLAAALAKGEGAERVYVVEPTGTFENDPNVTNQKFPGNLTRSYRSRSPLKIVGELTDWAKLSAEELEGWRKKLADNKGDIIN